MNTYEQQLQAKIDKLKAEGVVDMRITPSSDYNEQDGEVIAKDILDFLNAPTIPYTDPVFGGEVSNAKV